MSKYPDMATPITKRDCVQGYGRAWLSNHRPVRSCRKKGAPSVSSPVPDTNRQLARACAGASKAAWALDRAARLAKAGAWPPGSRRSPAVPSGRGRLDQAPGPLASSSARR
jgi:hypothetical protein